MTLRTASKDVRPAAPHLKGAALSLHRCLDFEREKNDYDIEYNI